ncbi:SET domain-containing protein, partial [Epithele typhae]|uniref:SET domain-containing protein n=1 Tax=Epithele typhae TaxID=378194 RepID=UPI002008DF49
PIPSIRLTPIRPAALHIRTDPHCGRRYHASKALSENTDLLGKCAPYSATIWKRFRNEVCAECWRYDRGRKTFLTRKDDEGFQRPDAPGSGASGVTGAGLSFCDAQCQRSWIDREGLDAVAALRRLEAARQKKPAKPAPDSPQGAPSGQPTDVTQAAADAAWAALSAQESSPKAVRRWATLQLDDYEADMARYVLLALLRYLRELPPPPHPRPHPAGAAMGASSQAEGPQEHWSNDRWATFASLQTNELALLRACPGILEHQTLVYSVLRARFRPNPQTRFPGGTDVGGQSSLADLVTVENIRTIFGVDPGNAFGIWETPLMEESECLGFAVYPMASFFNHSCSPNVRKERQGRVLRFVTTSGADDGEELCISYGPNVEGMGWETRQKELLEGWYFACRCARCVSEMVRSGNEGIGR